MSRRYSPRALNARTDISETELINLTYDHNSAWTEALSLDDDFDDDFDDDLDGDEDDDELVVELTETEYDHDWDHYWRRRARRRH